MNGKLVRLGMTIYHADGRQGIVKEVIHSSTFADGRTGPIKVLFKILWADGSSSEEPAPRLRKTPVGTSNQDSGFNYRKTLPKRRTGKD